MILIDHRECGGGCCKKCKNTGTMRVQPYAPSALVIPADEINFEIARLDCPCYEGISINAGVSQCSHPRASAIESACELFACPALADE